MLWHGHVWLAVDFDSAQILSNGAKLIHQCSKVQMDDDPKYNVKATQILLKAKKLTCSKGEAKQLKKKNTASGNVQEFLVLVVVVCKGFTPEYYK